MANRFWADRGDKDSDGDGLSDDFEYVVGTNPQLRDTDGDGLNDLRERDFGSNPLKRDSDGDELDDYREVILGTNPQDKDTDGDGADDRFEIRRGTAAFSDSDGDGTPDWLDRRDSDRDGLTDAEERWLRTDPNFEDTDEDGHNDWMETWQGHDPRFPEGGLGQPLVNPGSGQSPHVKIPSGLQASSAALTTEGPLTWESVDPAGSTDLAASSYPTEPLSEAAEATTPASSEPSWDAADDTAAAAAFIDDGSGADFDA